MPKRSLGMPVSQFMKMRSDQLNPTKQRRPKPGDAVAASVGLPPGSSHKEIAKRLGTSAGKVSQAVRELNGRAQAAHLHTPAAKAKAAANRPVRGSRGMHAGGRIQVVPEYNFR